ncbi:MAG: hypothetical protein DRI34_09910 [Deltaproteobacteria bacterium]|nr:MAG: hypothetical protein DRI34_09910 [Deltaproteobacteria bacterium]
MKPRFLLLLPVLAALLLAAAVQAGSGRNYSKQFDHWSRVIADLKSADVTEGAARDIEIIRTWIGQAQAFLASEKFERINMLLRRIEAQAAYCRAKINRLAAEDAAEEAETLARNAEQQAESARQAADAAEARMKELEAQGL